MSTEPKEIAEKILKNSDDFAMSLQLETLARAYLELLKSLASCPACGEQFTTLVNDWNLKETTELKFEIAKLKEELERL